MNETYNRLNLEGLRLVFIGMILEIVSGFLGLPSVDIEEMVKNNPDADTISTLSVAGGLLSIIGLILVIVGVGKLRRYSNNYNNSFRNYFFSICFGIAGFVVIIMAAVAGAVRLADKYAGDAAMPMLVVAILLLLASFVFSILAFRSLFLGCADISASQGNQSLAYKCVGVWKMYLIGIIIMIVLVIAVIIIALRITAYMTSDADSGAPKLSVGVSVVLAGIGVIADAIFVLIVQIIALIRIDKVYKMYDNAPIGGGTAGIPGFGQGSETGAWTGQTTPFQSGQEMSSVNPQAQPYQVAAPFAPPGQPSQPQPEPTCPQTPGKQSTPEGQTPWGSTNKQEGADTDIHSNYGSRGKAPDNCETDNIAAVDDFGHPAPNTDENTEGDKTE